MLITQSGNFQNFEFKFLAGISSNTWQTKIERNQVYCEDHCRRPSRACSHAPGRRRGRAQPPLPRPEPWEREETRKTVPGPPLYSSSSLQAPDHRALASTDPQHTAAETKALQPRPKPSRSFSDCFKFEFQEINKSIFSKWICVGKLRKFSSLWNWLEFNLS
jgi:hypothetical protein